MTLTSVTADLGATVKRDATFDDNSRRTSLDYDMAREILHHLMQTLSL